MTAETLKRMARVVYILAIVIVASGIMEFGVKWILGGAFLVVMAFLTMAVANVNP